MQPRTAKLPRQQPCRNTGLGTSGDGRRAAQDRFSLTLARLSCI
jgi:hypothetical protein